MGCLFCGFPEPNYKPDLRVDFICSRCVVLLAGADQGDLKRAHGKAIATGYLNKASAIESFIIPEVKNGKRPSKFIERDFNRGRTARTIRDEKRRIERVAI